jgi:hypothetical protein
MTLLGFERNWLLAIFDTVVPSGADERIPEGAKSAPMDRFLDDLLAHAPAHFCLGLRACTWILSLSPIFVLGQLRFFASLSPEDRIGLLRRFSASPNYVIREMPLLFKTVACLGFCGLPDVQSRLGIRPVDAIPPEWARARLPLAKGGR